MVNELIRHMYAFKIDDQAALPWLGSLVFMVHVVIIADKYDVPRVAKLAETRFSERANTDWATDDFATAIELIYGSTALLKSELPRCVVRIALAHEHVVFAEGKRNAIRAVADRVPEFATALASGMHHKIALTAQAVQGLKSYQCKHCHNVAFEKNMPANLNIYCRSCNTFYPESGFIVSTVLN